MEIRSNMLGGLLQDFTVIAKAGIAQILFPYFPRSDLYQSQYK